MSRWEGKQVLITSGPTGAPLDAVRFITNRSTGRLGVAIAREFLRRGSIVTFVHGKGSLVPRPRSRRKLIALRLVEVFTVDDLIDTMRREIKSSKYSVVIHSMAVLDYVRRAPLIDKKRADEE